MMEAAAYWFFDAAAALCAVCLQVCLINRCQIITAVPMTQSACLGKAARPFHNDSLCFSHTLRQTALSNLWPKP